MSSNREIEKNNEMQLEENKNLIMKVFLTFIIA